MIDISAIILGLLNASTLILVAAINRNSQIEKKRDEERYKKKLRNERLTLELMQCDCRLSVLTAKKVAGEHVNGDLEKAIECTEEAYDAYSQFINNELAEDIVKWGRRS